MQPHSAREIARQQLEFARRYTLTLLDGLDDSLWLTMPAGCPTHVAWQVGHLAMAEYGLCLFRTRGRKPEDNELMSSLFRKIYSKGSVPDPDPAKNPAPAELRQVLDRVHAQVLQELPGFDDALLHEPVDEPYVGFPTKLGALLFCSHHEMIHAGQLGILRRLLGKIPVR